MGGKDNDFDQILKDEFLKEAAEIEEEVEASEIEIPDGLVEDTFRRIKAEIARRQKLELDQEEEITKEEIIQEEIAQEEIAKEETTKEQITKEETTKVKVHRFGRNMKRTGKYKEEYGEDIAFDIELIQENRRQKSERRQRVIKRISKRIAMIVATLAGVFAITMTSEANRNYLIERVRTIMDGGAETVVNTDGGNYSSDDSDLEVSARKEIKEQMGITFPEFMYKPDTMEFSSSIIISENKIAIMQYTYQDQVITIEASESLEHLTKAVGGDGENTVVVPLAKFGVEVYIVEDLDSSIQGYIAQWKYQNCYYTLAGKMSIEEIKKIFNKISF